MTIGGGHGQAVLLEALAPLDCDLTAVVSVADDGGCSGQLRERFGIPPPGDVRRCLSTLARDRPLARRFEERLPHGGDPLLHSAGNLVLLEAYLRLGSFQQAVDWAAELLRCRGRVVPVAEVPARLATYDRWAGLLEGETNIAARSSAPMVAAVHGADQANLHARRAIEDADWLLFGPGSFVTSLLAAVTTGGIATAIVTSPARRLLVHNLAAERGQTDELSLDDYVRLLRDHLVINSGEDGFSLDVLEHIDGQEPRERTLQSGTRVFGQQLASRRDRSIHDPDRLREVLRHLCSLSSRGPSESAPPRPDATETFDEYLESAAARLTRAMSRGAIAR